MAILNIDMPDTYRAQLHAVRVTTGVSYKYQILAALRDAWGWEIDKAPVDGRVKVVTHQPDGRHTTAPKMPTAYPPQDGHGNFVSPEIPVEAIFGRPSEATLAYEARHAKVRFEMTFNQALRARGIDTHIQPPIVPVPEHTTSLDDIPALMAEVDKLIKKRKIKPTLAEADRPTPQKDEAPITDIDPDSFSDEELERMAQGDGEDEGR